MQTIQVQNKKDWNKKQCTSPRFLDERAYIDRDDVEWIAMYGLVFGRYSSVLIEAKQKGWDISKSEVSHASEQVIQSPADLEFEKQREAFENIPPEDLAPYHGQFVASIDGVIVGSDEDLMTLDQRVLEQYGDVPVYITKVGERAVANIPTSFVR